MERTSRTILTVLFVALVPVASLPAQSKRKPVDPARILPGDTLAAFFVADYTRTKERFTGTALSDIWAETEVEAYLRPVSEQVRAGLGHVRRAVGKELGITEDEFATVFSGATCVAVLDVRQIKEKQAPPQVPHQPAVLKALRMIANQQRVFRSQVEVDQDGDGRGEFGLLGELCGELALRPKRKDSVAVPYLAPTFKTGGATGRGYATSPTHGFRLFLPSRAAAPKTARKTSRPPTTDAILAGDDEALGGSRAVGGTKEPDADVIDFQERQFLVYAWPLRPLKPADRAYVINEKGDIYSTVMEDTVYGGRTVPEADAAYSTTGRVFRHGFAPLGKARDGNCWRRLPPRGAVARGRVEYVPSLALFLSPHDKDVLERLPTGLLTALRLRDETLKAEKLKIGRETVTKIWQKGDPKGQVICHMWLGGTFLITLNVEEGTIEEMITNYHRKSKKALEAGPAFTAFLRRTGAGEADAFVYVALARFLDIFEEEIPPHIQPLLQTLGLHDTEAAGASVEFAGKGIRDAVYLHAPGQRQGWLDLISAENLGPESVRIVPGKATSCVVTRFNAPLLWQNVKGLAEAMGDEAYQKFELTAGQISQVLNVDIDNKVAPALGDALIAYLQPPEKGAAASTPLGDWALLIRIKDQALFDQIIEKVRRQAVALVAAKAATEATQPGATQQRFQWQSTSHKGVDVRYLPNGKFGQMAHAVTKDYLIVAMHPHVVCRAVDRLTAKDGGITARPDFKAAMERVGGEYGSLWFTDVTSVYDLIHPLVPLMAVKVTGGLPLELGRPLPADVIKRHLFCHLAVLHSDDEGISVVGYSPVGSVGTVAGIAGIVLGGKMLGDLMP